MSTSNHKLRVALGAVVVAVFVSGSAYALDDELFDDEGTSRIEMQATSCGSEAENNIDSFVVIEPEGAFVGFWAVIFGDDIIGEDGLSGIYIEAKPGKRLTMALADTDYLQLNNIIDGLLGVLCGGDLINSVVIDKFEGKFSNDLRKLKVKFRSSFTWVDVDMKERKGHFNFTSKFDNVLMGGG
jgi:hypothetical protein